MKYLCLGYLYPEKMDALPNDEKESILQECGSHLKGFYETNQVMLDAGLDAEVKSLKRVNGKVKVIDGPFIETKELIGSAILIEARDMEEAIEIASKHPSIQIEAGEDLGWAIEIRPIHYFEMIDQK
ncbi:YciI family protein [Falsibacillus albus]|uniref:YCII-related domain-containing protein n=1 Tax=Falsibacillus albus TaxID=2478915 RepID=A0A3L7JHN7_9BACI|nr:YciI family protein [Falsibacillus albus]RLQ89984.1 hypothetical protein D9X91_22045 [Falsibacillus albus]